MIKLSPTNPEEELLWKKHLEEADQVGEDEEGSGVVDPLEEAEEDEGAPVDDEPRWEDRLHPPYWEVLPHKRSWNQTKSQLEKMALTSYIWKTAYTKCIQVLTQTKK